jgi:hypothetical protein
LFSGLGSYYSDRIFPPRYRIFLCALILIGILVVYGLFLNPLLTWMISRSDPFRILLSVTFLMPLGFFMGIPFPQGLSAVKEMGKAALPWAWGINGFFSVISVILANILAISWGFSTVLFLAGGCYLAAGVLSLGLAKR